MARIFIGIGILVLLLLFVLALACVVASVMLWAERREMEEIENNDYEIKL